MRTFIQTWIHRRKTVERLVSLIERLNDHYDAGLYRNSGQLDRIRHDLKLMVSRGDLKHLVIQLIDERAGCQLDYRVDHEGRAIGSTARAIEQSGVLPERPGLLRGRLFVKRLSKGAAAYASRLLQTWHSASPPGLRHLEIYRSGSKGYAFAKTVDDGQPVTNVYCHQENVVDEFAFTAGKRFYGRIVRVQQGIQAHDMEA